jgi:hypothetical protein
MLRSGRKVIPWQDWLVDEICDQETRLAESEESDHRRKALGEALSVLNNRERRIFEARRLADDPITLGDLASEFGVSRVRVRQIEGARLREGAAGSEKPGHLNLDAPDGLLVSSPRTWSLQPHRADARQCIATQYCLRCLRLSDPRQKPRW